MLAVLAIIFSTLALATDQPKVWSISGDIATLENPKELSTGDCVSDVEAIDIDMPRRSVTITFGCGNVATTPVPDGATKVRIKTSTTSPSFQLR